MFSSRVPWGYPCHLNDLVRYPAPRILGCDKSHDYIENIIGQGQEGQDLRHIHARYQVSAEYKQTKPETDPRTVVPEGTSPSSRCILEKGFRYAVAGKFEGKPDLGMPVGVSTRFCDEAVYTWCDSDSDVHGSGSEQNGVSVSIRFLFEIKQK